MFSLSPDSEGLRRALIRVSAGCAPFGILFELTVFGGGEVEHMLAMSALPLGKGGEVVMMGTRVGESRVSRGGEEGRERGAGMES